VCLCTKGYMSSYDEVVHFAMARPFLMLEGVYAFD
jgi:hypothetical protein